MRGMWDIHCHILPEVDDGAKDMEMAKALLQKEMEDGVQNSVILTPHYRKGRINEPVMSLNVYSTYEQREQE